MAKKQFYKLDRPNIQTTGHENNQIKLTMTVDNKQATILLYDWQVREIYVRSAELLAARAKQSSETFKRFKGAAQHIQIYD